MFIANYIENAACASNGHVDQVGHVAVDPADFSFGGVVGDHGGVNHCVFLITLVSVDGIGIDARHQFGRYKRVDVLGLVAKRSDDADGDCRIFFGE